MSIAQLLLGVASLMVGTIVILLRGRIVTRARHSGEAVQPEMAWLVVGTVLALNGVLQVVLSLSS